MPSTDWTQKNHYITDGREGFRNYKEEVTLTFPATWRGTPCTVRMSASRYEHSTGISDWRIYADEIRDSDGRESFTDLARQKLGAEYEPVVTDWLKSAEYQRSYADAIYRMVRDGFYHLRPYGYGSATADVRAMIAKWAHVLPAGDVAKLTDIADTYDLFNARLTAGGSDG